MDNKKEILESQIREIYARIVWTQKTHEKCHDILHIRNNFLKISELVISSLTTTGILFSVFGENKLIGIVSAIFAFILVLLKALTTNYDLGEVSEKYASSANLLLNIREKYLSLLTDIQADIIEIDQILQIRDELQKEVITIYKNNPKTFSKAYKKANDALKNNDEFTFSENEIDLLLPNNLRKNK